MKRSPHIPILRRAPSCHGRRTLHGSCSRNILKRALAKADTLGYGLNLGMEAEFFVLRDDPVLGFKPISDRKNLEKPAYDVPRTLDNLDWIGELIDSMNSLGWDVYSFDHEDGIGQFEIDFRYFDALSMADKFVFFRMMAHEIARKHGGFATFMPKPYGDRAGSGAHFNMSLADKKTGKNLFADAADPRGCGLSKLGYQFLAGILKHLPAICAVVAPTVNSYKRLVLKGSMSGFHLGAGLGLLWQQQPHEHTAHSAGRRTRRTPGRRQLLQSLPRCSTRARRRSGRHCQ
jgi:glutamine synthetase